MRIRFLFIILFSTLLGLSACGSAPTTLPTITEPAITATEPIILKETQLVEVTRIVEQTQIVQEIQVVTVEVTRIVQELIITTPSPQPFPMVESSQVISLRLPRAQHTATRLPDGSILFVGGSTSTYEQTSQVEIYDPGTGITFLAAPLHTPRHAHTATLLPDGRVLVVGGSNHNQGWLDDAEIYDPSTNEWLVMPPPTSHGVEHTATLMNDGRVLVVGGAIGGGQQTDLVDIFDPQTNSWYAALPLASDRASHTAMLLNDGRVLVIGGGSAAGIPAGGEALLYDPQLDTWTATGPMVMPRVNGEAAILPDGSVLVAGGINLQDTLGPGATLIPSSSSEIFDPVSNIWSATAELIQPRNGFVMLPLKDGRILAIGGVHDAECCLTENSYILEIEFYDPSTQLWNIAGDLPQPAIHSAGVLILDGRVWVTGGKAGESGEYFLADTWLIFYAPSQP